jgi:hypothetical protein
MFPLFFLATLIACHCCDQPHFSTGAKGAAEDGSAVFRSDAELWPEAGTAKAGESGRFGDL